MTDDHFFRIQRKTLIKLVVTCICYRCDQIAI